MCQLCTDAAWKVTPLDVFPYKLPVAMLYFCAAMFICCYAI